MAASTGLITPRQTEILGLITQGLTDRAMGLRLGITEETVAHLISGMFERLGAQTRAQAVYIAMQKGLL